MIKIWSRCHLTCRADQSDRSSLALGNWASSSPRTSRRAWWFAGDVRRTLCPGMSRRAAGSWTPSARGRRTAGGPCGNAFDCRVPELAVLESRGCRWPCTSSVASCRCRLGCRPSRHPGRGYTACPHPNTDSLLRKPSPWLSGNSVGQHAWLNRKSRSQVEIPMRIQPACGC